MSNIAIKGAVADHPVASAPVGGAPAHVVVYADADYSATCALDASATGTSAGVSLSTADAVCALDAGGAGVGAVTVDASADAVCALGASAGAGAIVQSAYAADCALSASASAASIVSAGASATFALDAGAGGGATAGAEASSSCNLDASCAGSSIVQSEASASAAADASAGSASVAAVGADASCDCDASAGGGAYYTLAVHGAVAAAPVAAVPVSGDFTGALHVIADAGYSSDDDVLVSTETDYSITPLGAGQVLAAATYMYPGGGGAPSPPSSYERKKRRRKPRVLNASPKPLATGLDSTTTVIVKPKEPEFVNIDSVLRRLSGSQDTADADDDDEVMALILELAA